ncbi:eg:bacr7a4.3 protein-related [Holotrichia oblita]|uniref:Eg:bacr7a4.3 protein-related n=1 Tax=Holotrichia oblita TaxID=644536 RepID=A0ACB9T8H6_HOLOL|nr:eg:bacr7a4.3 protein-related [Holotrichia oblita]
MDQLFNIDVVKDCLWKYNINWYFHAAKANYSDFPKEGGLCTKRNGEKGICTHFTKCEPAIEDVRKNGRPEICSFSGKYPIVCCPTSNSSPSSQEDLNWQQKIGDDNDDQSGDMKYIRLGGFESSISNDHSQHQSFTVKNIHIHHKYQPSSGYYDIALLELNQPATFTEYIKPACLAVTEDLYGTLPELTGIEHKEDDNKLVTYYYTFVSNGYCKKIYGGPNFIKEGIKSSQICATSKNSHGVEAGGPLQITNFFYEFGNFPEIVGLSSFGKPDEEAPDVFTRVYSYVPWIESIVWPN